MITTEEMEKQVNAVLKVVLDQPTMTPTKALAILFEAQRFVSAAFGVQLDSIVLHPKQNSN